jgi:hypothetical protein
MSAPAPAANPTLNRGSILKEWVGDTTGKLQKGFSSGFSSISSTFSQSGSSSSTSGGGSYGLQVLFYLVFYALILFLILVLVHYTVYPVFSFKPGDKGVLVVANKDDGKVYWNDRRQPGPSSFAPLNEKDSLLGSSFTNTFTLSVDLLVRRLTETNSKKRLILMKVGVPATPPGQQAVPFVVPDPGTADLAQHMSGWASMIMYLTETNDLIVSFFSGPSSTVYSCSPIKNIPLNTPFRISVVVEEKLFTVYLNTKQVFQRVMPTVLALNGANPATDQRFSTAPAWADAPTKSIFVQNLHIWTRALKYVELQASSPALARIEDFDAPSTWSWSWSWPSIFYFSTEKC